MTLAFLVLTLFFVIVSVTMILIILVQRPAGGGLAGAFGGAGGGGTETIFGGRVGDALTWATVVAFVVYIGVAIGLNRVESAPARAAAASATTPMVVDESGRPVEVTPIDPPFAPDGSPVTPPADAPTGDGPRLRLDPSPPPTGELPPELSPFAPKQSQPPADRP
jgi:preprotein translocase subunit SecG